MLTKKIKECKTTKNTISYFSCQEYENHVILSLRIFEPWQMIYVIIHDFHHSTSSSLTQKVGTNINKKVS